MTPEKTDIEYSGFSTRREFLKRAGRYILLGGLAIYAGAALRERKGSACPETGKRVSPGICDRCPQHVSCAEFKGE